ncbi:MAG: HEPN domain-containing protein [Smithella sp.]
MRIAFLKRLHKEGVLQLVTPSNEMKTAYLKKSESHLTSARLLLENDLFEQAVSMAYYSMYYTALALFYASGIKCENHTATIILLEEVFALDKTDLEDAKRERIDKQYYVTSAPVRDEVVDLIQTAELFNAGLLDGIDRLTNEKIEKFRKKFKSLI